MLFCGLRARNHGPPCTSKPFLQWTVSKSHVAPWRKGSSWRDAAVPPRENWAIDEDFVGILLSNSWPIYDWRRSRDQIVKLQFFVACPSAYPQISRMTHNRVLIYRPGKPLKPFSVAARIDGEISPASVIAPASANSLETSRNSRIKQMLALATSKPISTSY